MSCTKLIGGGGSKKSFTRTDPVYSVTLWSIPNAPNKFNIKKQKQKPGLGTVPSAIISEKKINIFYYLMFTLLILRILKKLLNDLHGDFDLHFSNTITQPPSVLSQVFRLSALSADCSSSVSVAMEGLLSTSGFQTGFFVLSCFYKKKSKEKRKTENH